MEYQYLDNLFYSRIPRLNHLRDSAQATGNFRAVSNASKYGTTTILKICQLKLCAFYQYLQYRNCGKFSPNELLWLDIVIFIVGTVDIPCLKARGFFLRRDSDEFTCKKASQAVCPTAASPLIRTT